MLGPCRWPLASSLVLVCLVFSVSVTLASHVTSVLLSDHRPSPLPATPPTPPTFDQYDGDDDQIHVDDVPADPTPSTPPKAGSTAPTDPKGQDAPQPQPHEAYKGTEYRFKRFVIRPAQLKLEGLLFATLVIYVAISYMGKRKNEKAVVAWLDANAQLLNKEFSHVGYGLPNGYIANGPALFYAYATGRKACQSLLLSFALRPRQDVPYMIYEELRAAIDFSWTGRSDRLELVWSLSPNNPQKSFESKDSFVWALVEKRVMNLIREDRWDVRTFTDVKESDQLPSQLVFMAESGEITEQIIKNKELGLLQLLKNNPACLQWFDSLVLSGSPQEEPPISKLPLPATPSARTLMLRLRLPASSRAVEAQPLVQFCFDLIDSLGTISLTSIAAAKLSRRRTETSNLLLEEERKSVERAKEEDRRKRIKAVQDQKLASMSPADQRKHDQRERKRNAAKIGKATVKRK